MRVFPRAEVKYNWQGSDLKVDMSELRAKNTAEGKKADVRPPSHTLPVRNPLHDTVRQSGLGFLQDETCHSRGFVIAEHKSRLANRVV